MHVDRVETLRGWEVAIRDQTGRACDESQLRESVVAAAADAYGIEPTEIADAQCATTSSGCRCELRFGGRDGLTVRAVVSVTAGTDQDRWSLDVETLNEWPLPRDSRLRAAIDETPALVSLGVATLSLLLRVKDHVASRRKRRYACRCTKALVKLLREADRVSAGGTPGEVPPGR